MTDHAAVSPSSAEMWMNCPASVTLAEGRTRPSSLYAKEGTAAHRIAEMILAGELFPPGRITVEGSEFIVGLPMLRALNPYIDFVQQLQNDGAKVRVEQRVVLGWADGLVWGTTDCVAKRGSVLDIVDLKYGKGVAVNPDHAQLKIYALAAIHSFWPRTKFATVNMTVVQPRLDPVPQTFSMDGGALSQWGEDELRPAVQRIVGQDTTERYGHWCRWCVRKAECNAFKLQKNTQASEIFDDGLDKMQHAV